MHNRMRGTQRTMVVPWQWENMTLLVSFAYFFFMDVCVHSARIAPSLSQTQQHPCCLLNQRLT